MEKTLHFIALYNTQIIQVGFGIVLLLIVVYVYRIFFMSNVIDAGGTENFNAEVIEEKLNIIIDQQKQRPTTGSSSTAVTRSSEEGATPEEVDKLKSEIYNLRQQIAESEKNANESKGKGSGVGTGAGAAKSESAQESAKAVQLEAKITDLQSRLSEYEIIADDIAELSQLRTENAKLIQELAAVKASSSTELPTVKTSASEVSEIPAEPVQPSIEEMMGMDSSISAQDQNSIDDFEKNVLKKENE